MLKPAYFKRYSGFDLSNWSNARLLFYADFRSSPSVLVPHLSESKGTFNRPTAARYRNAYGLLSVASVNEPRLQDGGLLVERSSTNQWSYSQQIENGDVWDKVGCTVESNQVLSPDGVAMASALNEGTGTGSHFFERALSGAPTGKPASISFFVKNQNLPVLDLETTDWSGTNTVSRIDIDTVTAITNNHNIRFERYANGWIRVMLRFDTGTGASTPYFRITMVDADGSTSYTGTSRKFYLWGLQAEYDQARATSYIPTTTTAVLRSRDMLTFPFNSTLGSGMTLQAEFTPLSDIESGDPAISFVSVGSSVYTNNQRQWFGFRRNLAGIYSLYIRSGGVGSVAAISTGMTVGERAELTGQVADGFQKLFKGDTAVGDTSLSLDPGGRFEASTLFLQGVSTNAIIHRVVLVQGIVDPKLLRG